MRGMCAYFHHVLDFPRRAHSGFLGFRVGEWLEDGSHGPGDVAAPVGPGNEGEACRLKTGRWCSKILSSFFSSPYFAGCQSQVWPAMAVLANFRLASASFQLLLQRK